MHIELGLKKLFLFSFFAASTEFLRRGSCLSSQKGQLVPPSNGLVASPQPLTLNKAASCDTCLQSLHINPLQVFLSASAFFSMVGLRGTRCPRTTPVPFHQTVYTKPSQFYFPLPVNSFSLYNFTMFPWILIATLCLGEISLPISFVHHCVATKMLRTFLTFKS